MNGVVQACADNKDEEEDAPLPGFRFHPTDEELVGFYLQRKVDNKPLKIDLIKQIDIYKFDPWDLPKASSREGDIESYFFCRRGRKYRNSIRPNRATGSGFWKATGIDKPIYSNEGSACIGLKKTLVYYRGTAGKGTKTDWMMHEFRLPNSTHINASNATLSNPKSLAAEEAEVWTICRIFKRSVSHRKYTPDWREIASNRTSTATPSPQIICSMGLGSNIHETCIAFGSPLVQSCDEKPGFSGMNGRNQWHAEQLSIAQPSSMVPSSSFSSCPENNDFFTHANWDELKSVVEFAFDPFSV